jgi:uncharacterized protein
MLKLVVLLAVVLLVLWIAKVARGRVAPPPARPPRDASGEVMLSCVHCGVHLPTSEALPGRGGVYCSAAHRALGEARDERP